MSGRAFLLDIVRQIDSGEWYWLFSSTNGRTLARSSESYTRRGNCEHSARLTLGLAPYTGSRPFEDGRTYSLGADNRGGAPVRVRVLP